MKGQNPMDNLTKDLELMAYRARYHQDFIKPEDQAEKLESLAQSIQSNGEKLLIEYEQKIESLEHQLFTLRDVIGSAIEKVLNLKNDLPNIQKRSDLIKELDEITKTLDN
ncbi:MAG: hypothetical protein IT410_01270 [Candidatus Doudnabacteria bacterium]|nr:hypothetical protein [Candidatus Doudnabacteria bacterium]